MSGCLSLAPLDVVNSRAKLFNSFTRGSLVARCTLHVACVAAGTCLTPANASQQSRVAVLLLHFALIKHHVARATPSQVAWLPPTRRMRHAAVLQCVAAMLSHLPLTATRWHFAAAAADGSELIGLPRTNCATKKEQREENGENAAGCCPPAAAVTCCLLSPAFVCLLSICGQCDRMPGQHTAHTHGTHTHSHTHVCSSAPKMGQLNVSRFPETKAMPFNFGLSLATLPYSVCPAAVCLMDASLPSQHLRVHN